MHRYQPHESELVMTDFTIEMLPAREGDCLLISFVDKKDGSTRRVLVDGGRAATYGALKKRLEKIPERERELELFVITHIDRDHIEGVLKVLEDAKCPVTFRDIWFNGYRHLPQEAFGAAQGERLTSALLDSSRKWNAAFKGKAIQATKKGVGKTVKLRGGLTLTVLSPDMEKLKTLRPVWERECDDAGIVPNVEPKKNPKDGTEHFGAIDVDALAAKPFEADKTEANGSSIGLLAEYHGKRVLLGADCHVDRLLTSVGALAGGGRLKLDAFKLPHHGSAKNVSRELIALLDCKRFLISTSGAYFKHPTREAIARILRFGGAKKKEIHFNYRSKYTESWGAPALAAKWQYDAHFPDDDANGSLVVEL